MLKPSLTAVALALALAARPAVAQEDPALDTVLATVDGTEITLGHAIALRATLPEQYDQVPPRALFDAVMDQLVQQTLIVQDSDGQLSTAARLRLENERRAIIANDIADRVTSGAVTDDAIREAYEAEYDDAGTQTEYRAAHILVETREEADKLAAEIADGANFAALAQEHSIGPSGASGGKLGWFGKGVMVPDFFEAVVALEEGDVSEPVKTEFGWHLIKLAETRSKSAPGLDAARDEIADTLRQKALTDHLDAKRAETTVEVIGTDAVAPDAINRLDLLEN